MSSTQTPAPQSTPPAVTPQPANEPEYLLPRYPSGCWFRIFWLPAAFLAALILLFLLTIPLGIAGIRIRGMAEQITFWVIFALIHLYQFWISKLWVKKPKASNP